MIKYLQTFFKEKNLSTAYWNLVDNDGVNHSIDSNVVIEFIGQTTVREQNKIADMIRTIDFQNGDINKYLKHLAGALINQ